MIIIIGLVILVGGVAFGIFTLKTAKARMMEMQSMQTTSIADALDIVNTLSDSDPSYRHYAEIKGTLCCDEPLKAPYTEKLVAFYESECKSVNEVTERIRNDKGEYHTRVRQEESTLSSEKREARCYIKDNSCSEKIYVNLESFGSDLDLVSSCDRMERDGSTYVSSHSSFFDNLTSMSSQAGARFLGYRLIESIFNFNIPVYSLGEIYKAGNEYRLEYATAPKKTSIFTYKSEDSMVESEKSSITGAYIIIAAAVVIGLGVIIYGLV